MWPEILQVNCMQPEVLQVNQRRHNYAQRRRTSLTDHSSPRDTTVSRCIILASTFNGTALYRCWRPAPGGPPVCRVRPLRLRTLCSDVFVVRSWCPSAAGNRGRLCGGKHLQRPSRLHERTCRSTGLPTCLAERRPLCRQYTCMRGGKGCLPHLRPRLAEDPGGRKHSSEGCGWLWRRCCSRGTWLRAG